MTSAPGPARPMTDAEIVLEAIERGCGCEISEFGTSEASEAAMHREYDPARDALARLAACAERGETLGRALRDVMEARGAGGRGQEYRMWEIARAALAGAAPEPAHEPRHRGSRA